MFVPILATKLFIPTPRPQMVLRPRLVDRLHEGLSLGRKLTLISAPAGFGKTSLVSEWVAACERQREPLVGESQFRNVAWLSLDEGDSDPTRFLTYLIAALQTLMPETGEASFGAMTLAVLQSPQPPSTETILTTLINDIITLSDSFILVLDDYHVIDSKSVDDALAFLVEHSPPQIHLVITTREDPHLPLARLRTRGQLTELRAVDLRFLPTEAADFLNRVMGLNLSEDDIAALDARTEGWIAGLQLAALSMQGQKDADGFIKSFTGSHHFVLDYLVEEVLSQQSESVQAFLLRTSILERLCGPLCDAVLGSFSACEPGTAGQESAGLKPGGQLTLENLEHANLFIVPLDNERRWYRYHHLFRDFLRQRLRQRMAPVEIDELHIHASEWFESNGLLLEAFHHATAANDVERAERLMESEEIGLHFRSVAMPILDWLTSLPKSVLNARPRLWVRSATTALMMGQSTGVEEKLQMAEAIFAAQEAELDDQTRDLIGQMACARATLALFRYDHVEMVYQARRALEYLSPDNLTYRFTANWALTSALMFQGDRAGAAQASQESIAISQKSGHVFSRILAASNKGALQEMENQLHQAAETYQQVLRLFGEHPQPNASVTLLGLARIYYEWNDLNAAEQYGLRSLQLSRQLDSRIDRFIVSEVFLARLKLARGDAEGAAAQLAQAEQTARQNKFLLRLPEIAAAQVSVLLRQRQVAAAAQLVQQYALPMCQARVALGQGNPSAALATLEAFRQQMEAKGWVDEQLKAMALLAVAYQVGGEEDKAVQLLSEVLAKAEPGGFIRLFIEEGEPMANLLSIAAAQGIRPGYVNKLLAAFGAEDERSSSKDEQSSFVDERSSSLDERAASALLGSSSLVETLNMRELEVLRLIAQGLSNQQIGARLFLALDTVKGYNRRIFEKLQVHRRTEAIARARELGIL